MIDYRELTIGSHVNLNGVRARVTKIAEPYIKDLPQCVLLGFTAVIDGEEKEAGAFYDAPGLLPIEITEEILNEIGFEKRAPTSWRKEYDYNSWVFITHSPFDILLNDIMFFPKYKNPIKMEFKYLHELEAIWYMITKQVLIP